jgi:hypothetical protein
MASNRTLMERLCMPTEERTHRRLPLPFAMMSEDEFSNGGETRARAGGSSGNS